MRKPRVMVAVRDTEHLESLMKLVCDISIGRGADLIALHVVKTGPGLPLDADGEMLELPGRMILSEARRIAFEEYSMPIFTRLARGHPAGKAIVVDAKEHDVDLLILGYQQPHGVGELFIGSTVQYVARHAPCRVIVEIPRQAELRAQPAARGEKVGKA